MVAVGLIYIGFLGWRLLPIRDKARETTSERFKIQDYITEVRLRMLVHSPYLRLQEGDLLVLETDPATLKRVLEPAGLELVGAPEPERSPLRRGRSTARCSSARTPCRGTCCRGRRISSAQWPSFPTGAGRSSSFWPPMQPAGGDGSSHGAWSCLIARLSS